MEKTCENCGKVFWAVGKRAKAEAKYCSRACYWEVRGRSKFHVCAECGKEFINVNDTKAKYCSRPCVIKAQSVGRRTPAPSPLRVCGFCGVEFRRYGNNSKYCSQECYHKAPRKELTRKRPKAFSELKENYPKGWEGLKSRVLLRDSRICQKCFSTCEGKGSACVHHIIDRHHNELHELVTLCRFCHTQVTYVEQALKLLNDQGAESFAPFVYALQGENNG